MSVAGLKEAGTLPGVERVELIRRPGPISWREGDLARVATISGLVGSHAGLLELMAALDETVSMHYTTE